MSMHSAPAKETPERNQQRDPDHRQKNRVFAQETQAEGREAAQDHWGPGATKRRHDGAKNAGTVSKANGSLHVAACAHHLPCRFMFGFFTERGKDESRRRKAAESARFVCIDAA